MIQSQINYIDLYVTNRTPWLQFVFHISVLTIDKINKCSKHGWELHKMVTIWYSKLSKRLTVFTSKASSETMWHVRVGTEVALWANTQAQGKTFVLAVIDYFFSLENKQNIHDSASLWKVLKWLAHSALSIYPGHFILRITHVRHPITRPWGRGMGCQSWVQGLI